MIDYALYNENTKEDFAKLVQLYAKAFFRWRSKNLTAKALPLAKALAVWWRLKGPTDFKSTADTFRFKADLRAEVEASHAAV